MTEHNSNNLPDENLQPTSSELKSVLTFLNSKTDQLVMGITQFLSSARFLIFCILVFALWLSWNLNLLSNTKPFDPFPFPLLEMSVSLFAIILSVSVLINQNRQGKVEKIRQQVEFNVNVRAEEKITKILNMVHDIHRKLGIERADQELNALKESIDLQQIHHTVKEQEFDNSGGQQS